MDGEKIIKLVTHNGSFHADDIFSSAVFALLFQRDGKEYKIFRTRDKEIIENGDIVFDVGGIYDPAKDLFDHHQTGGAGKRENGIEYASFGLVWKKYGVELCGDQKSADLLDTRIVAPIDANDNGQNLISFDHEISPYFIQSALLSMRPTWLEADLDIDEMFLKSVEMAKNILEREIIHTKAFVLAEEKVLAVYENTEDKRILVLDKDYPFDFSAEVLPETFFVIYPRKSDQFWGAKAVRKNSKSFGNRKDFPKDWAGLMNEDIVKSSGVNDAVFCHRALFLAVAKSKEGAVALAKKTLE
ncbi:MAG: MYG1 family protein [Candidatus Pacebacteria bacterium]|nr:MYG1 family protein [Candidatus Paceibacterota bacterium]MCF7863142.1 MYG1 family protein [Candidatus Paceibacterota bacterium]